MFGLTHSSSGVVGRLSGGGESVVLLVVRLVPPLVFPLEHGEIVIIVRVIVIIVIVVVLELVIVVRALREHVVP